MPRCVDDVDLVVAPFSVQWCREDRGLAFVLDLVIIRNCVLFFNGAAAETLMILPLLIGASCVVTSIIGTFFVKLGANNSIMGALYKGFIAAAVLSAIALWPVTAWIVGKTALGLRSDYLAIATLGIAEIIIAVLKNEECWIRSDGEALRSS